MTNWQPGHPGDLTGLPVHLVGEPLRRVAILSDVHGNIPALRACLGEALADGAEAVIFLGDLTWGPEPVYVLAMVQSVSAATYFIRGNGERAVLELADGTRRDQDRFAGDDWVMAAHGPSGVARLRSFVPLLSVAIVGLGRAHFCHGSPRSDIEVLTPATPEARLQAAFAGVHEPIVVHGHTHLQYERSAAGKRILAPGSVGLPAHDGPPGARWAMLGPEVQFRTTAYDLNIAEQAGLECGWPGAGRYVTTLRKPPTSQELCTDAEAREFAD